MQPNWIPNTISYFTPKNTSNYHDEMIAEHFEDWFAYKLLPNVRPNSLIIMNNASYHSRRSEPVPVKSWTKKKMQKRFRHKGIEFPPKAKKVEIFSIMSGLNPTPRYAVDDMEAAAGQLHMQQLLCIDIRKTFSSFRV